jgi:hypothetical protein
MMSRRIVTTQLQSAVSDAPKIDGYFDRLVKYIPSDVVGLWLVGVGMINTFLGALKAVTMIVFFLVCLVITIWWTKDQTTEPSKATAKTQVAVAAFAFIVWVIALQGPDIREVLPWYKPAIGSLLLLIYSTVIARKVPKE